jgi:polysaccharide chain length determinant protein (PEP-CTERM system associated)
MTNPSSGRLGFQQKSKMLGSEVSVEHYLRVIGHRKLIILGIFVAVTAGVAFYVQQMPNIYTSYSVIGVKPQKVPESYVRSTVTGDIRNRLSTLSNEILSTTQLQKIIENLKLYPEERKKLAREDVTAKMRKDIATSVLGDFGGNQDLQAFKIQYSGRDPQLVSEVANRLASAFIDENSINREQQAKGTTEFIEDQLEATRKLLESQEAKIRDFNLKHMGRLPEQQSATVQLVSQLQAQLQIENEALAGAQQHRKELEAMLTQPPATVVDMDPPGEAKPRSPQTAVAHAQPADPLAGDKAQLAALMTRYSATYPAVRQLKNKIAQEEAQAKAKADSASVAVAVPAPESVEAPGPAPAQTQVPVADTTPHVNPVIQSQIRAVDEEIAKHIDAQQRYTKQLDSYRDRLDSIPVTQQELTELTRDYEISKAHYSQLLDRKMNAETATQLEVRLKGEQFEVLDPALPAERPTSPNRGLIDGGGAIAGLILGLLAALCTELFGMSVTDSQDVADVSGLSVLGVIPVILTQSDKMIRRRRWIIAAASTTAAAVIVGVVLLLRIRNQV